MAAVLKNWAEEAAMRIAECPYDVGVNEMQLIITEAAPFKPDVAYMPVPRCESCRHWDNIGGTNRFHGWCRLAQHDPYSMAAFTSMVTHADFGCVAWRMK